MSDEIRFAGRSASLVALLLWCGCGGTDGSTTGAGGTSTGSDDAGTTSVGAASVGSQTGETTSDETATGEGTSGETTTGEATSSTTAADTSGNGSESGSEGEPESTALFWDPNAAAMLIEVETTEALDCAVGEGPGLGSHSNWLSLFVHAPDGDLTGEFDLVAECDGGWPERCFGGLLYTDDTPEAVPERLENLVVARYVAGEELVGEVTFDGELVQLNAVYCSAQ